MTVENLTVFNQVTTNNTVTKENLFKTLKKVKSTDRVLLLTHTDLDAVGSFLALKFAVPNVDVKYCTNSAMNGAIYHALTTTETLKKYDVIMACDISCDERTALNINSVAGNKFVLLDHHPTATYLNRFNWASVQVELVADSFRTPKYNGAEGHSSGTSLMFDYLEYCGLYDDMPESELDLLKSVVHLIASYDTWDWVNVFNNEQASKDLNSLCSIYGLEFFSDILFERISNEQPIMYTKTDKMLLAVEQAKIDAAMQRAKHGFVPATLRKGRKTYTAVYSFVDQYLQETFACMREKYPNRDLYIIHYGNGVSIRTDNPEIHVGDFVKSYGGGGHAGAGGFRIKREVMDSRLSDDLDCIIYKEDANGFYY